MARKKRQKRPAKPQQKFTVGGPRDFAEHTRRTEASKKRKRVPKGMPGGGRFAAGPTGKSTGAGRKGRANPKGGRLPKMETGRPSEEMIGGGRARKGLRGPVTVEGRRFYTQTAKDDARRSPRKQLERQAVSDRVYAQTGQRPTAEDYGDPSTRVTSMDIAAAEKQRKEANWQTQRGVYAHSGATRHKRTGKPDRTIPPTQFIKEEMAPSHQQWLSDQLRNRDQSELFAGTVKGTARLDGKDSRGRKMIRGRLSPAERHRLEVYTRGLQQGKSHKEALQDATTERRGRKPSTVKRTRGQATEDTSVGLPPEDVDYSLDRQTRMGRKLKYESSSRRPEDFGFGLDAESVSSINDLAEQFPGYTDRQLVQLQQAQRQTIFDQLDRNARWAQETKAARLTGGKQYAQKDPNRVVFFTTSLGHPAPSVPSDSLVGQYIIRRRKNMLQKEGIAKGKELSGSFPDIVRDMHVIEASTGVGLGAEGDIGVRKRSGWRIGTHKSRGFGKSIPFGSQLLYDSQGRPMYDNNGNQRYTEGATRKFRLGTPDLGFRVFIG